MPKSLRIASWALGIALLFQLTSGCFSFRMSQKEVDNYFAQHKLKPQIRQYKVEGRTVNYASVGSDSLPTVIFMHGAPGSWSAFIHFFKNERLTKKAKIISVDRPGYGKSDFGNSEPSLNKQSQLFHELLVNHSKTKTILVGHSLGGPVIAKMAMDYPDLIDGLIMVAPSIDPALEPDEVWFRFPLHTPFLRWILPTSFRVTNDEIYFLEDQLETMKNDWHKVEAPTIIIQGGKDKLVPAGNADYAKKMLTNASSVEVVMIKDMNHFVPWNHPDLINKAIFDLL